MDSQKHYTLMINPVLKKAFLSGELEITELVYSDKIEDLDMQLLFYGFKIIKPQIHGFRIVENLKQDTILNVYYDLEPI